MLRLHLGSHSDTGRSLSIILSSVSKAIFLLHLQIVYLTGGFALGDDRRALLYGLLGVGSVNADTSVAGVFTGSESIDDSGNGISFGAALEYGFTDSLGIRVKALHTRYKGDVDELKIRDTSIMGGLVYSF